MLFPAVINGQALFYKDRKTIERLSTRKRKRRNLFFYFCNRRFLLLVQEGRSWHHIRKNKRMCHEVLPGSIFIKRTFSHGLIKGRKNRPMREVFFWKDRGKNVSVTPWQLFSFIFYVSWGQKQFFHPLFLSIFSLSQRFFFIYFYIAGIRKRWEKGGLCLGFLCSTG